MIIHYLQMRGDKNTNFFSDPFLVSTTQPPTFLLILYRMTDEESEHASMMIHYLQMRGDKDTSFLSNLLLVSTPQPPTFLLILYRPPTAPPPLRDGG